jgi:hypothetical protein
LCKKAVKVSLVSLKVKPLVAEEEEEEAPEENQ